MIEDVVAGVVEEGWKQLPGMLHGDFPLRGRVHHFGAGGWNARWLCFEAEGNKFLRLGVSLRLKQWGFVAELQLPYITFKVAPVWQYGRVYRQTSKANPLKSQ